MSINKMSTFKNHRDSRDSYSIYIGGGGINPQHEFDMGGYPPPST
jgi:hypothetical protein